MIIYFWQDRMGSLHGDPKSARKRRWADNQLHETPHELDALIFRQEASDYTVQEIVGPKWQDVIQGYTVSVRVPDDTVVWLAKNN